MVGYVAYADNEWYEKRVVGHDMLERFMKLSLTKNVKLDGSYTNHSIRATVISTLDSDGFEARHITSLSSHKSEATICEYSVKCPENKKKEMFNSLTSALTPQAKKPKMTNKSPTPAATAPNPNPILPLDVNDTNINLPNFQLEPLTDFETIDDDLLLQIVRETERNENSATYSNPNDTNGQVVAIPPGKNVTNNTQVINQTMPNLPRLPPMYFPNSTVTINYNFGK